MLLQHFAKQGIVSFVGLAYPGKDIVFRFIMEYSSLRPLGNRFISWVYLISFDLIKYSFPKPTHCMGKKPSPNSHKN
jgi:hypothetical protein